MPSLQPEDSGTMVHAVELATLLASNPTASDGDDNDDVNNKKNNGYYFH